VAWDYAKAAELALAIAVKKPCPMCDSVKTWTTTPTPMVQVLQGVKPLVNTVPVVCSECGYVLQFVGANLDRMTRKHEEKPKSNGH
jgi:hypothetical protein